MEQLVGLTCGVCDRTISSVLDGKFCDDCGVPYHHCCRMTKPAAAPEACGLCGCPAARRPAPVVPAETKPLGTALLESYRAMQAIKWGLGGCVVVGLGVLLLVHPDLRSDPARLSARDLAVGLPVIGVGCIMLILLYWAMRRK